MSDASSGWVGRLRRSIAARTGFPRNVLVLAVVAFFVTAGFGVVIPVLPVYASSFGVSQFLVGMVISSFALMRLVMSPFVSPLINLWGERVTLGAGIFIVAASSFAMGFSQEYWQLLTARAVGGIGSAMFTVSAMTLLISSVPGERRGRAVGMFQGGFLLGNMAGPALGGLFVQISLTAPFFFYAATLTASGTVGLLLLRSTPSADPAHQTQVRPFREVLRDTRYQAALMSNFAHGWTSMGVRSSLTPVVVVSLLHRDPAWTGIAFAVAAVAQTIALGPVGRAVDTTGRRPVLILGALIAGTSILAVPVAPNIWVLMVALMIYGIGASMLGTAPAASVGDAAGGRSGTPVAVFSMTGDVGAILGPLVAGLLWDYTTPLIAYGVGSGLWALTLLMGFRMAHTPPRPKEEDDAATTH